jgi:transcriptional regulator with GAF, ATPase, and Fis domain
VVARATTRAETEAVDHALREAGGDRAAAAARLGVTVEDLALRLGREA